MIEPPCWGLFFWCMVVFDRLDPVLIEDDMAKLTAAKRRRVPTRDFAGPGRTYPVEDRGHAIAAKGRAKTAEKKGRISSRVYKQIVRKANRKLGR